MMKMIAREANLRREYLGNEIIETIYFGGGTPSLPDPKWIDFLLNEFSKIYSMDLKEVTLEANPDDLKAENLHSWKKIGIDRLSLGIQSFDDRILQFYNRAHNSKESLEAIGKARDAGFSKFSMDLIYGFPWENHDIWKKDLELVFAQNPGHISCYALTVEPKTALGVWEQKGKFSPADEDFVAEQFEILQEESEKHGYDQYEISNFSIPGKEALHNTNYWKSISYLGLGPGAHSFDGKQRGSNIRNNIKYIQSLQNDQISFEKEDIEESDILNEYILTSLRTSWGIDLEYLKRRFGKDLKQEKRNQLDQFEQAGWLLWGENTLSLSKSGKLLADSIASALFF